MSFTSLFEPSPKVHGIVERRRARLLAVCMVCLTVLFGCVDGIYLWRVPGYAPPWYGYAFLITTYALSRTSWHRLGALFAVLMFPCVAFTRVFLAGAQDGFSELAFLSLCPLMGAIFLPMVGVAGVSAANLILLSSLPWLLPSTLPSVADVVVPIFATAMSTVLSLLYIHHRDRVELDRQLELATSEERLRLALEVAEMGMWDWDTESGKFVISVRGAEILGASVLPGGGPIQHYLDCVHSDDAERVRRAFDNLCGNRSLPGFVLEHKVERPGGEVGWVAARGRVTRWGKEGASRVTGSVVDITQQKQVASQLRQAQKMEAVGRLAGGVAHDFNNLLTVILGNLDLARNKFQSPHLDQIDSAATSAAALTSQLLAFSRQAPLALRALDLNDTVEMAVTMIRRIIGEDIEIEFKTVPELWHVRADENQVQEVLLNLATNARDAMTHGGRLTIVVENDRITEKPEPGAPDRPPGDFVKLSVIDTGVGMDEDTRAQIFEPFFTTKEAGKGTGLGLAMVFGVVAQCKGTIEVRSEPGRGTCFEIRLPRVEAALEATPKPRPVTGGSETILVVEDEERVRLLMVRLLQDAGYTVMSTGSPAEAQEICAEHGDSIDLLLSDVVMPGRNGPELVAELRRSLPNLKVLFMTGYAADLEIDGDISIVNKPFNLPVLLGQIREVLEAEEPPAAETQPRVPLSGGRFRAK
ncbi:MAG: response regulator [Polyangiaceae bacterium]|nr:response regulator [Polyangiaceae bacterium]